MKHAAIRYTRRPFFKRLKEKGMTMTEMAFVLLIAALIGLGVVRAFSTTSASAQASQLADDLNGLVGRVKNSYAGQYNNVSNTKLSTGGFFKSSSSLTDNAGTVTTGQGGGTLVVSAGTVTAANDSVKYVLTQLPDDACLPLVTSLAKSVTTLSIGANVVKAAGSLPDPSKVTCSGDNNTLTFQVQ
jgi:type II secretory pathway pseudopilin PulG